MHLNVRFSMVRNGQFKPKTNTKDKHSNTEYDHCVWGCVISTHSQLEPPNLRIPYAKCVTQLMIFEQSNVGRKRQIRVYDMHTRPIGVLQIARATWTSVAATLSTLAAQNEHISCFSSVNAPVHILLCCTAAGPIQYQTFVDPTGKPSPF